MAIHAVSPGFAPEPYAWGKYKDKESEACFLLEEFRDIREQVSALELLSQHRHLILAFDSPQTPSNSQQDLQIFTIGPSRRRANLASMSKRGMEESRRM